ncbi:MAG: LUD domain-containing protein [Acidimicrobiaceae bacterium]|nr:LUD domain-containing protein [Acidimicrobiaceae bacterium]
MVHHHDALHEGAPGHVGVDVAGREGVLSSIAAALGDRSRHTTLPIEREYHVSGQLDATRRRELLKDRLLDYRAHVVECERDNLGTVVNDLLVTHGSNSLAAPHDIPTDWLSSVSRDVHFDEPSLSVTDLDSIDSTLSGCAVAVAQTGTIVLDSGERQGRRALSLIPDHLIIVIFDDQIVELVPEAVARLTPTSTQTWISGPSATSDIELERIEGVHGPRTLDVILVI